MTYRDKKLQFQITFPEGWKMSGSLHRFFRFFLRLANASSYISGTPEFYGPAGNSIKFAVGPISPVPTLTQHQANIETMANRHGHKIIKIGTIYIAGKDHVTMVVDIPLSFGLMRLKNYFLIFGQIEYVITASLEIGENACDLIVKTFQPL